MTDRVLVPVDGSPLSFEALEHAVERYPEAALTVLHVVDLFETDYADFLDAETTYEPMIGTEEWYDHVHRIGGAILEEAERLAGDRDRTVETADEIGDPERVVVDYDEEHDVDQVILGAHAGDEARRSLLGSVAATVVRRAPCGVTVVR